MVEVKLVYTQKDVDCVETLQCNTFSIDSVATAMEVNIAEQTGEHVDVSPIRGHYISDNAFVFIYDVDCVVIGGYAICDIAVCDS